MAENDTLTPRKRVAIESLLTSGDVSKAAEAAGVTRKTLYRWLEEPEFAEAINTATAAALENLSRRLVGLGETAGQVLGDAMDATQPIAQRVRAAAIVLENILKLRELVSLEERISRLEAANNDNKKPT